MKLLIKFIFFFVCIGLGFSTDAQTTIWSVDFETGYSDNDVSAQDNNTPSGADWTKSGSPSTWWRVESDSVLNGTLSMSGRNTDGVMTWTSESISISGYSNVSISINLKELNCEAGDIIETFYNIGSGNVEFGDGNGDGNFNSATNTVTGLSGTTMTITVTLNNNGGGERLIFDDITVTGILDRPGSGFALDFDGSNDYVSLGTSTILRPSSTVSVEAWVYAHAFGSWVAIFGNLYDSGSDEAGYGLVSNSSTGNIMFWVQTSGGTTDSYSNYPQTSMTLNTWIHVAGTYDGSNLRLYINGELIDTDSKSGTIDYSSSPLDARIGQYYDNNESQEFDGLIDELRIWSTARSQTQIRDNMCKKLVGNETGLLANYRMDDGTGTNLADLGSNNLNGTLNNMTNGDWVTSAAAIGDDSDYLYTTSWSGQTIDITSTNKGTFEVNTVSGTPDGVQVYRVDEVPNSTTGISPALGSNDTYFGVFVVDGTSPTYTAELDYTGYADAIAEEPNLTLYNRADNSVSSWSDITATVNAGSNTISESGVNSSREFILGGSSNPLPVELIEFSATPNTNEKVVDLFWVTANEINNDYFTVERSTDLSSFEEVIQITGQGTTNEKTQYNETDFNPVDGISYYRLSQTDFDGKTEYFNIEKVLVNLNKVEEIQIELYPNPNSGQTMLMKIPNANSEELKILVNDFIGKEFLVHYTVIDQGDHSVVSIEMNEQLAAGSYMVNIKVGEEVHSHKLVVY